MGYIETVLADQGKWYRLDGEKRAQALWATVTKTIEDRTDIEAAFRYYLGLYEGRTIDSLAPGNYDKREGRPGKRSAAFNVAESCIDTIAAQFATTSPRVQYLGDGADWKTARLASKLTRYTDGQFFSTGFYSEDQQTIIDSLIFGRGGIRIASERGRIQCESVRPWEVFCDRVDGRYRKPRRLYHVWLASKESLAAAHPKNKDQIDRGEVLEGALVSAEAESFDQPITVIDAWSLPSGPETNDGIWTRSISTGELEGGAWNRNSFPFAWFRYKNKRIGFEGHGLAETLAPIQRRIDKLQARIDESEDRVPQALMVPKGHGMAKAQIKGIPWLVLEYNAEKPPQPFLPNPINPVFYTQIENLITKAYQLAGVSQLAAAARKPSGLDSGKALVEYQDIGAQRLAMASKSHNWFVVDVAELMAAEAQAIAKAGEYRAEVMGITKIAGRTVGQRIKWADVDLDRDKYILRPHPANQLPSTPAGKFQRAADMVKTFPQIADHALELLGDQPDVDRAVALAKAGRDRIEELAEHFMDGGAYIAPDPTLDLDLAGRIISQHLNLATVAGAPEAVLDNFREFLLGLQAIQKNQIEEMQERQAAAAAARMPAGPGQMMPQQMPQPGAGSAPIGG